MNMQIEKIDPLLIKEAEDKVTQRFGIVFSAILSKEDFQRIINRSENQIIEVELK